MYLGVIRSRPTAGNKVTIQHNHLTLNLLTTTIVAPPSNASKWQMGFNSAFKGLNRKNIIQNQKYMCKK